MIFKNLLVYSLVLTLAMGLLSVWVRKFIPGFFTSIAYAYFFSLGSYFLTACYVVYYSKNNRYFIGDNYFGSALNDPLPVWVYHWSSIIFISMGALILLKPFYVKYALTIKYSKWF
ncbi:MAG: hypothetical protein QM504_17230 [Pseudomonadota bacterium]